MAYDDPADDEDWYHDEDESDEERVQRGVALLDGQRVMIQDEVEAERPVEVAWNLHTSAAVAIAGKRAELTQGEERMVLEILSPPAAQWTVEEVRLEPPQRPISNVRRLSAAFNDRAALRLVVLLTPGDSGTLTAPPEVPLEHWPSGE